ncbi:YtxH domain-containing protein [uncultured Hymenobacter sp.]|uniref:YtxH domain-containing protein n=1 Tax=uncultured Hymenobacter sp. TaxID=170016 RepID=UPI0035CA5563
MSNTNGKVILSLLAGATAGVVAGLLLAPETGEATRGNLKNAATDFGDDLGKFLQDTLSKFGGATTGSGPNGEAAVSEDRAAADNLFNSMSDSNASAVGAQGDNATTAGL